MPAASPPSDRRQRRWVWRLGSLAGISVYIHATFVLLLAWVALNHVSAGHDLAMIGRGLLLVISVFAIVVLHELGHALVARRFQIPTRDITLYPIGGIARLERMPERPAEEFLVAIAGPAVNGILALAIYLGLRLTGTGLGGDPLTIGGDFAVQLMWINISLGAFNLLPAFPMDGGRILRAALAFAMDRPRATIVATKIARGLAVAMGIVGLLWSPWLAVIAMFVWFASGQEAAAERMKTSLRHVSVGDAVVTTVETLAPESPIGAAAAQLATGFQHDFPVVHGDVVVGLLTRDDVLRGLALHDPGLTVGQVMHTHYPIAGVDESLEDVLARLPADGSSIAVFHHEHLVGLLDPEHVAEVLAVREHTTA